MKSNKYDKKKATLRRVWTENEVEPEKIPQDECDF